MKKYKCILLVISFFLLTLGCKQESGVSTTDSAQAAKDPKAYSVPSVPVPITEPRATPKPVEDGKTIEALYNHLKSKGWEFGTLQPAAAPVFNAEETSGWRDNKRIGYVIMRYENREKAQANFDNVDSIYRRRFGRALIAENFILAVMGALQGVNKPAATQLEESEYKLLQKDLNEFFKP